jgi:hypothetical protein
MIKRYPVKENGTRNVSLNEALSDKRNDKKLHYILGPAAVVKQVNNVTFANENQMGNSVLLHKCIDAITKNIDRIDRESKQYYKEMITKMVT